MDRTKNILEYPGFDPGASSLLTTHSSDWANTPYINMWPAAAHMLNGLYKVESIHESMIYISMVGWINICAASIFMYDNISPILLNRTSDKSSELFSSNKIRNQSRGVIINCSDFSPIEIKEPVLN